MYIEITSDYHVGRGRHPKNIKGARGIVKDDLLQHFNQEAQKYENFLAIVYKDGAVYPLKNLNGIDYVEIKCWKTSDKWAGLREQLKCGS